MSLTRCHLEGMLLGLLVILGVVAALAWSLRTGLAYGGRPISWVLIGRDDNPVGFWSALLAYVLYGALMLTIIWLATQRSCAAL